MINPNMSDEEFFLELEKESKNFNTMRLNKGVGWLPQKFPIPKMKPIDINKEVFDKVEKYILNIFNNPKFKP